MRRPSYLAGTWYPVHARDCRESIETHAAETALGHVSCRGLIGPHAGWAYSGNVQGKVYRLLAKAQPGVDTVVIFGSHRGAAGPNTIFRGAAWQTPLGDVVTAAELVARIGTIIDLGDEPVETSRPDNAVEVHMPFVRYFFPAATCVMLGVAAAQEALEIGRAVGEICRLAGRHALFIGSTDLTHYGSAYGYTPKGSGEDAVRWVREENDMQFLEHLLRQNFAGAITHARISRSACCPGAAVAALEACRAYQGSVEPRLVEHYLSCDVRPASSFVGYAGMVF